MAPRAGIDRARVVEAAAELADQHGFEQLQLSQVAAKLGIRLPSLYNHVGGLAALRRELALLGVRQLGQRIIRAAVGKSGDSAMLAVGLAYRAYVLEHPGLYAASVRAPAADDHELGQAARVPIDVLLAVLEPYQLGESGAIHVVRGLRGVAHGFATLELAGGFGMPLDRDESYLRLLRAYIAGLRVASAD